MMADDFEPIITDGNYELLNGAIDVVITYHEGMGRPDILEVYTKPSDFPLFLSSKIIPVYITTEFTEEKDNIVYKYVVVLSEQTGQYELVEDPYTK